MIVPQTALLAAATVAYLTAGAGVVLGFYYSDIETTHGIHWLALIAWPLVLVFITGIVIGSNSIAALADARA
jgi:hypothetical protein